MNEWPKAVAIASIWISVGFSLGFGVFKISYKGPLETSFFLPLLLTALIIGGGLIATKMVCSGLLSNKNQQDKIS